MAEPTPATWAAQPAVTVQDVGGNTVTSTASITLAIGTNPGGSLACTTNPLGASGGVASFAGCKITGKAGSYTLTASAAGLTEATSNAFTITAGPATQLAFTTQPGGGANTATWTTQPAVSVEDQSGNVVTGATNSHHPRHRDQPRRHAGLHHQPAGRQRWGRLFRRLQDHRQGRRPPPTPSTAAATGLTGTTSNAFTITAGPATQLAFTTQPGGGADAAAWTTQPAVSVEDQSGNVVTTSGASIALAVGTRSPARRLANNG